MSLASLRSTQEEYQRKALGAFQRFGLSYDALFSFLHFKLTTLPNHYIMLLTHLNLRACAMTNLCAVFGFDIIYSHKYGQHLLPFSLRFAAALTLFFHWDL